MIPPLVYSDNSDNMDVSSLTAATQNLYLGEPECLPFCPQVENIINRQALRNIPRFLFRVATPKSRENNETWMRSDAARVNSSICREDVFFNWTPGVTSVKKKVIARTLNKHVRW